MKILTSTDAIYFYLQDGDINVSLKKEKKDKKSLKRSLANSQYTSFIQVTLLLIFILSGIHDKLFYELFCYLYLLIHQYLRISGLHLRWGKNDRQSRERKGRENTNFT